MSRIFTVTGDIMFPATWEIPADTEEDALAIASRYTAAYSLNSEDGVVLPETLEVTDVEEYDE